MTDSYVQVQGSILAAAAIIQFALPTFRKKSVGRERKDIYVQLDATDKAGNLVGNLLFIPFVSGWSLIKIQTVRQRIQKTLADMEVRSPGTKAFAITSTEAISSSLVGEDGIDWGCRKVYFELQKGGGAKAYVRSLCCSHRSEGI